MPNYLIDGQSPESLGITLASLSRTNQGLDVLTLSLTGSVDTLPWSYDDAVTVLRDGLPWFSGRVMSQVSIGDPAHEGQRVEIGGPWWLLSRLTYTVFTLDDEAEEQATMRLWLGVDEDGGRISSQAILREILDYAINQGVPLLRDDVTLDAFFPPRNTTVDRRCDELVRYALSGHPDVCLWWDYSTVPPTARTTRRGDDLVTYEAGVMPLVSVSLTPRPDLSPSGVVYRYERETEELTPRGTRPALVIEAYPPGASASALDALTSTITLREDDVVEIGGAQRLYEALAETPWDGVVTLVNDDVSSSTHPGQAVRITGGASAWGTMNALVQRVDDDLVSGITQLSLGLPQYMGAKPTIWSFIRSNGSRSRDNTGTEDEATYGTIVEPRGALCGYAERMESGDVFFRISTGVVTVGGMSGESPDEIVPFWKGTTLSLDDEPPPGESVVPGNSFDFWLKLSYTPSANEFIMLDDDGTEVSEWGMLPHVSIDDARMVFFTSSDAAPATIDAVTGDVTPGVCYLHWGQFSWPVDADLPNISPYRIGSVAVWFVPPGKIFVMTQS